MDTFRDFTGASHAEDCGGEAVHAPHVLHELSGGGGETGARRAPSPASGCGKSRTAGRTGWSSFGI